MSIKSTSRRSPCCRDSHNFNNSSFLQSRVDQRPQSARYFRYSKVRTCSYIKQLPNGKFIAIPYYEKRGKQRSQSSFRDSWYSTVHSGGKRQEHAGCGMGKSLSAYHPNRQRNRLRIDDFNPPYRNSSIVQFGDRSAKNQWKTTYNLYYTGKQNPAHRANPQIRAYRSRWDHQLLSR